MVLGISADTPDQQKKFKQKHDLPYTLLADSDRKVCESYGVLKTKSMFKNTFLGIERTTFLIGPEGKISRIFRKVKPPGHAEEVLAAMAGGS